MDGTRTSYQITDEPLKVIASNPIEEWKERTEVMHDIVAIWYDLSDPFCTARLFLHIRLSSLRREDRLAATDPLIQLISILKSDTKYLGQGMANFGASIRHRLFSPGTTV